VRCLRWFRRKPRNFSNNMHEMQWHRESQEYEAEQLRHVRAAYALL
jgi:hypothetical protein